MALVSYIIEENSEPGGILEEETISGLQSHAHYRNELIDELEERNNYIRNVNASEAFKSGKSLIRLARAWDLYLALENAYEDLGGNLSLLLNSSDKQFWNSEIHRGLQVMWRDTHKDVVDIPLWLNILTPIPGAVVAFTDVQQDEVQPGNWPLISHVSAGIAALGFNGNFASFYDDDGTIVSSPDILYRRALKSADYKYWDSNGHRYNQWWYQTGEGKGYWAEGPYYFEILLPSLIEFLHVHRSNRLDIVQGDSYYSLDNNNPFESSVFLNALNWHYNIATPDGNTPPLDDGNKKPIESAGLLSWSSSYGSDGLGKKFAYIRDLPEVNSLLQNINRANSRLVEISYPHVQSGQGTAFQEYYGNKGATQSSAQQSVLRKTDADGTVHYLLMNGERGKAITRGEGHEQVDQLQILYYVDKPDATEVSYLMDSGYDSGSAFHNSTWNQYRYHNVLSYDNAPDGGYDGPNLVLNKKRKVAEDNPVNHLYYNDFEKVHHLYGELPIIHYNYNGQDIYHSKYRRNLIFVEGDNNQIRSYIIDANADEVYPWSLSQAERLRNLIRMRYYSDTNVKESVNSSNFETFIKFCHTCIGKDEDLYIYMEPVEGAARDELYTSQYGNDLLLREYNNRDIGNNKDGYYASSHGLYYTNNYSRSWTSVAFLQVDNQRPLSPVRQINYPNDNYERSYQVWIYEHNDNVVDLYVKRAKPFNQSLANSLSFSLSNSYGNQEFIVSGGSQFGFARLVKQNGFWDIDNDYKVNISKSGYYYDSNQTIGTISYPTNAKIYVGDDVTLTFTGTVNLDDAEVFLGKDAAIVVNSSGKIVAEDTEFKRLNPNEEYDGVWVYGSDSNEFTNCTFTGAFRALQFSNSTLNNIYHSEFKENAYGMYVINNSEVLVGGGEFRDNDLDGIRAYNNSDITLLRLGAASIESNYPHFYTNGDDAIDLDNYSNLWLFETYFLYNNGEDISLDNTSRAYVGNGANYQPGPVGGMPSGMNRFMRSSGTYIYNLAMTSDGENLINWIVPAQQNYWNGSAPNQNWFHGPVDHSNWITDYSPTKVNQAASSSPQEVLSAAQVNKLVSEEKEEYKQQQLLRIQKDIMEIRTWMNDKPLDPENGRWLRSYKSLLHFAGKSWFTSERKEIRNHKNKWLARYHSITSLSADSLSSLEQQASFELNNNSLNMDRTPDTKLDNLSSMVRSSNLVGEVSVLLEIEEALKDQKYKRVLKLYDKYASTIRNTDNQYALLSALSAAYQSTGEYGASLAALEELEALKPDKFMAEGYVAPDLSDIKVMLADSARANSQKVLFAKQKPGAKEIEEEAPSEFKLVNAYPNPFNPTTTIAFDLPEAGKVRIEVYNISGKLVSVLSNQNYQAGRHQVTFNADGLASGVYFVRSQYGGITESQKITLVK